MKILKPRIVASIFGLVALVGLSLGSGWVPEPGSARAVAQVGAATRGVAAPKAGNPAGAAAAPVPNLPPWTAVRNPPQQFIPPGGMWAEVIEATSRWIIVQNQEGQQFPIAGDRIRQFLVRWPSAVSDLTPNSMVEATGLHTGEGMLMVDHIDIYEADAQNLVSPTFQNLSGIPQQQVTFDSITQSNLGITNWMEVRDPSINPHLLHVVGHSTGINPIQLTGFGPSGIAVLPGPNGMSMTQVTLGTNSYAKKGDLVHLIPEAVLPRGLDVSQLVLYKKIPLRQFQP